VDGHEEGIEEERPGGVVEEVEDVSDVVVEERARLRDWAF
jgi:hypothetical protein